MKYKISKLPSTLFVLILLFSGNAWSQAVDGIVVNEIWAGGYSDGGEAVVRIYTNSGTFSTCTRSDGFVIYSGALSSTSVVPQNLYFEQQYSMLLAAQHAGDTVSVFVSGCTADGKWPKANRITSK